MKIIRRNPLKPSKFFVKIGPLFPISTCLNFLGETMVQFSHHLAYLLQNICTVLACYRSITCRCARNVVSWARNVVSWTM